MSAPTQLERFRGHVEDLLAAAPAVYAALHPDRPADDLPGWAALWTRYKAYAGHGGKPVLVATLYGPSGAGKSTLFRLLTGLDVPAGDDVRPCTYACAAAVPASADDPERLARLFPGHRPEPFASPDQLREPDADAGRLLYARYAAGGHPVDLVLVDVPDFNTVATTNWDKAERMLERAEVVLFVVYKTAYADAKVIGELARCCRKAGSLAYLFTMTERAAAEKMWPDLLAKVAPRPDFAERRQDGRTLAEFLAASPVYVSPRSDRPELAGVGPLTPESPPFDSLLRGLDAERLVLAGLMEPAGQAAASCRRLLADADAKRKQLDHALSCVDADVAKAAELIAGSEFPAGRMMQLVLEESRRRRSWWMRVLTAPFSLPGIVFGWTGQLAEWFTGRRPEGHVVDRAALERRRLDEAAGTCSTKWRGDFPPEASAGGLLAAGRLADARGHFAAQAPPEPSADWEETVRAGVAAWAEQNPWQCAALAALPDLLVVSGTTLLAVDLCTSGGVFSTAVLTSALPTLGVAGAAAGGVAAAGVLVQWLEHFQIRQVLDDADARWRKQRAAELAGHLRAAWSGPLFAPWARQLAALKAAPAEAVRRATDGLDQLKEAGT